MAQTSIISWTIQDADGNQTTFPLYFVLGSLSIANIQTYVNFFSPLLDAVTDGLITRARVQLEFGLPDGLKTDAVALSNIQEGGLIAWDVDGTTLGYSQYVPAFFQDGFTGKEINFANTDVGNFVVGQLAGSSTVTSTDKYGNEVTATTSGRKRFRKFRRQE